MLESTAGKILQLENENKRLQKQLASLRGGNDDGSDARKTTKTAGRKLQHIANGTSISVDTNGIDVDDLEAENTRLKLDVRKLQARLVALQTAGDNFPAIETRASLLDIENKRLIRKVESFQQTVDKVESLEQENGRLISELERAATKAREWSEAAAELELEKEKLERSLEQLEKIVDAARLERHRTIQLEEELSVTQTERDRLQRHLAELAEPTNDAPHLRCVGVTRGVARNLFWGYKSFFLRGGGIKLLNNRSDVILPHKNFTWADFWGYKYRYTPVVTPLSVTHT